MIFQLLIFVLSLAALLYAARLFTKAAELIGGWMGLPSFVIGIFIVGIGTSLPELISGILAAQEGASEIVAGNVVGANISNILLVTGLAVALNKGGIQLGSTYIFIDLHFLLGSAFYFFVIAYDGEIYFQEAAIGLVVYAVYGLYQIRNNANNGLGIRHVREDKFPFRTLFMLLLAGIGIYYGARYTVSSLQYIALAMQVPRSLVALTMLSLGTTLPELAVNITAIRQGKAEMAVGNVLGSSVFNTLMIPPLVSAIGVIQVPEHITGFALPVMGAAVVFFYFTTQDKRVSFWEGWMMVLLYILFLMKTAGV